MQIVSRPLRICGFPAAFLAALVLACGGGGGPSGPSDGDAPAAPDLSRISVEVPVDGRTTVLGLPGAVEARSTVIIENLSAATRSGSPVVVETNASPEGAFSVSVPAQFGDALSILARDDGGNRGPSINLSAGPGLSTLRLSAAGGSDQFGVVNRALTDPFEVRVRGGTTVVDLRGVSVRFEVVSGGGRLDRETAVTDESGVASARLTLGSGAGPAQVRARVEGVEGEVLFGATATGAPEVASVTPGEADRGATVTVSGRNFSPIAAHNQAEFNGVAADVTSAAPDRLTVRVPSFASDGPVTVTLTGVRSNALPFKVSGPPPTIPGVGSVELVALPSGSGEIRLGFLAGSEEYVVAVEALSTTGGVTFGHGLSGDAVFGPAAADPAATKRPAATATPALAAAAGQARLDGSLRLREAELAEAASGRPRPPAARLSGGEPQIGERRTFHVINTDDPAASITDPATFDEVQAVLRYVGPHTLVWVDERTGSLDLTDGDVRGVGDRFEDQTYGIDRDAFGSESDIDGDARVSILLTPTVNAINRGASPQEGIVIGFFFGLDLVPSFSQETSNAGEIFYGFVPDPSGRFGPPIQREFAIPTLDEVFAHEFQHMISFNEHVLLRGGQTEALWLNEGLSHIAEDLNGFDDGNEIRSAVYLVNPAATGLARRGGGNSLEERGASFLFLRHLADQRGEGILRQLVQTRLIDIGNLEAVTTQSLSNLFSDWFAALLLDDTGAGDARFQIPSLTVRATYEQVRVLNPLLGLGPYLGLRSLSLPGASVTGGSVGTAGSFYAFTTAAGSNERKVAVGSSASAVPQVTVVRTR